MTEQQQRNNTIRVAAAQFHVGSDIAANLTSCLSWLDKASACKPDLILLPEFCNHNSWYDDKQHCYEVSVTLDGDFLKAIAAKAAELSVYVVINCTVQREGNQATGSSLLYSPSGELLADNTKQIYIGHENDYLVRASSEGPVVETAIGRCGLYACMDGVINETPRCLSLNGAQMILNSFNSFATDEGSLHVPVRAAENKVYVVAANKVSSLVPEQIKDFIAEATGIPPRFLDGAGESQIVAPDGTVLALASKDQEEFIFADIEVAKADDKCRPDGTDIFKNRRPELYTAIAQNPAEQTLPAMNGSASLEVAIVKLDHCSGIHQLIERVSQAVSDGAKLIALPPLLEADSELDEAASYAEASIAAISRACGDAFVTTSIVEKLPEGRYQHSAVVISSKGLVHRQGQVHYSERYSWSELVDSFECVELPFGRLAVVTSDDSIYPETFRLLALAGAEVATVALAPLEDWELNTGLLERSAENRINLLVAPENNQHGVGFITELQTDFTVMTPWQEREFDGLLSHPVWHRAVNDEVILIATVHPANAADKVVSQNTDLLVDRPWDLAEAIVRL